VTAHLLTLARLGVGARVGSKPVSHNGFAGLAVEHLDLADLRR
jgi:hypothetical protein